MRDHTLKGKAINDEEGEEPEPLDPQLQKEIEELVKIQDSGVGSVILKDFQKKKKSGPSALDPRSASRTPSASKEPHYRTRYESPVFACRYFFDLWIHLAQNVQYCRFVLYNKLLYNFISQNNCVLIGISCRDVFEFLFKKVSLYNTKHFQVMM